MEDLPAIAGGSPVRTQYLVFGSPSLGEEEILEVCRSMRSGWVGTGPKVKKFEEMFKKFKNCRQAIAVSSCTAALHLHPFYQKTFGYRAGEFPNAEFISHRTFSLPFSAKLTHQDVEDVIQAVKKILAYYRK